MSKSVNDFSKRNNRGCFHELEIEGHDAFGKKIADTTRTEVDIASHYNFSPERMRFFKNGNRQFIIYDSVPEFNDDDSVFELSPSSGDNVHLETAESAVYSVGYELACTLALSINQSLTAGDKIRFGPYNGNDGWLFEQRGGDHDDDQGDLIVSKGGTETTLETNVVLPRPITDWCRYFVRYNWYNVGHQVWGQTFTDKGDQNNEIFAKTSVDADKSTNTGNVNIWYEAEASSSTNNLQLDAGSMSVITQGNTTNLDRLKQQEEYITLPAGNDDTWVPLLALRIDPNNPNVNGELQGFEVQQYGNNADLEMIAVSFDPSKTDASDFTAPEYHHSYNTSIQSTENITEVPDINGTQKVLTSSDMPGGYTLGTSALLSGGGGSESVRISNPAEVSKKQILKSDYVVFLARSSSSGGEVDFSWRVKQLW